MITPIKKEQSIYRSCVLAHISLSVWSGRKQHPQSAQDLGGSIQSQLKTGVFQKQIFTGIQEFDAIKRISGKIRNWHHEQTLPWSESGERLLPLESLHSYEKEYSDFAQEFEDTVNTFLDFYPKLISTQKKNLGALFAAQDYPDVSEVLSKFNSKCTFSPLIDPESWQLNVADSALRKFQHQYRELCEGRVKEAIDDLWLRLQMCLVHMTDRLADSSTGERKIFRDSLVANAVKLCHLSKYLNITADKKFETARKTLDEIISTVDIQNLRTNSVARKQLRSKLSKLLENHIGIRSSGG